MLRLTMVFALMISVSGCGSADEEPAERTEAEATVFDDQVEALDKAKQVEELANDRLDQLNSELEEDETAN